jgi:hypothetical protein
LICVRNLGFLEGRRISRVQLVFVPHGFKTSTDSGQSMGRSFSYDVALGDVDGDGDLDAFIANRGQPNKAWLNNGPGVAIIHGYVIDAATEEPIERAKVAGKYPGGDWMKTRTGPLGYYYLPVIKCSSEWKLRVTKTGYKIAKARVNVLGGGFHDQDLRVETSE